MKNAFDQVIEYNNKLLLRSVRDDCKIYIGQQWASMISFMKKIYSKQYQKDIITDRNVKLWKKLEELADY